jgi:glycosyl hydrolase family 43
MLNHARPHATSGRRGAIVTSVAAVVVAVALGAAGVLSLHAPSAGARTAKESRVAHLSRESALSPASTLGSAVGTTALGLRTSYYEPPPLADPQNPGFIVDSGADQPDPFVFVQNGRYYLFTSQDQVPQNVPVRSATLFGQWSAPTDALPDPPAWAVPNVTWAPDVAQFGSDYLLYFTAELLGAPQATMCIGDAISTNPAGPYLASPTPLICQQSLGGSIDPRVFVDSNGQPTMIWKSDQNSRSVANTQIWSQPLSADGLHLIGSPTVIFGPDEPWQGHIVEAPQMILVKGIYYLFYSAGWFNNPGYAIGAARCAGPAGPCHDTTSSPLLASNAQGAGPGEESLFTNDVGIWMTYTPWCSSLPNPGPPRPVALAHLGFGPDGPYLAQPLDTGSKS